MSSHTVFDRRPAAHEALSLARISAQASQPSPNSGVGIDKLPGPDGIVRQFQLWKASSTLTICILLRYSVPAREAIAIGHFVPNPFRDSILYS
ncbi:uncharacterized protein TrAFT101_007745 [Trichoderma asperellum]|uniref:uncharacterized protein n=1 Tax=Trichoderma asperellum TaxID=101201 RepID=UPI00332386F3|nr:hypothetical protein TrAFT101_007745 [Trichoderma asperellum]